MRFVRLLTSLIVAAAVIAAPTAEAEPGSAKKLCVRPALRKEWRDLTSSQQKSYLNAVACLAKKPHSDKLKPLYPRQEIPPITTNSSFYDDMVYLHMDLAHVIHNTGLFLPWHRWYINTFFDQLKTQCGYKGPNPYWDYSKDSKSFEKSTIFDPELFGGWGDPEDDYQIPNGLLKDLRLAYPVPHHIRRQYRPQPLIIFPGAPEEMTKEYVETSIQPSVFKKIIKGCVGDFDCLHNATEPPQTFHGTVHLGLGGDSGGFCPKDNPDPTCAGGGATFSSNEPLFFLHHANIDRIWALWQEAHPDNKMAFSGGSIESDPFSPMGLPPMLSKLSLMPTSNLFPEQTVGDVMDTEGGHLCYKYV